MTDLQDLTICDGCTIESDAIIECKACEVRLCPSCNEEHKEHQ